MKSKLGDMVACIECRGDGYKYDLITNKPYLCGLCKGEGEMAISKRYSDE